MKKILVAIVTAIMILTIILSQGVFAHQGFSETFDFNTYVGNGSTYQVLPPNGSLGTWGNYNFKTGTDGAYSVATDRGTSLAIRQLEQGYPAARYNLKVPVVGTIHLKASMLLTDSGMNSYHPAVYLYPKNSSMPCFAFGIDDTKTMRIFNSIIYDGDYSLIPKANIWYDFEAVYNPQDGFYEGSVCFEGKKISVTGRYGTSLADICLIGFVQYGLQKDGKERVVYFDDFSFETLSYNHPGNLTESFDSYLYNKAGNMPPEGFVLQNFIGASGTGSAYAGAFARTTEKGKSLALSQNTEKAVSLNRVMPIALEDSVSFTGDLMVRDYNSTRTLFYSGVTEDGAVIKDNSVFSIQKGTGRIHLLGQDTGIMLSPNRWYTVKAEYTPSTGGGRITVSSDGHFTKTAEAIGTKSSLKKVTAYRLGLSDYDNMFGFRSEILYDNLKLSETEMVYVRAEDREYPFDVASSYPETGSVLTSHPAEIKITFSNPLAPTALDDIRIVQDDKVVNGIELVDDYTVSFPLQRTENGAYNIEIKNVRDCYGNSLSDSLDFVVKAGDTPSIIIAGTQFTQEIDGETVVLPDLAEGMVTATVRVQ